MMLYCAFEADSILCCTMLSYIIDLCPTMLYYPALYYAYHTTVASFWHSTQPSRLFYSDLFNLFSM